MKKLFLLLSFTTLALSSYAIGAILAKDYEEKANAGDAEAQFYLGHCYEYGKGIATNYEQAAFWYKKAAEQDYRKAQNDLGNFYFSGIGVKQDYEQATFWYHKAAEQGDEKSQSYLGYCYFSGNGVEQDYKQATFWYCKAAAQGDNTAKYYLEEYAYLFYLEEYAYLLVNDSIREEMLFALYDKIQISLDSKNYQPQEAVELINKYLDLALPNDENRGELLYTLGNLYANNEELRNLSITIRSLQRYDRQLAQPEWSEAIQELQSKYDILYANRKANFGEYAIGSWVSDLRGEDADMPLFIINIYQNGVLAIKEISPGLEYYDIKKDKRNSLCRSQSFFLDPNTQVVRSVSGTEWLNLGIGNGFTTELMTIAVQNIGDGMKDYIYASNKNFWTSILQNTAVDVATTVAIELVNTLAVAKKEVQVWTFDLKQNEAGHLEGTFLRNIYTMYSDQPNQLFQDNKTEKIKFIKADNAIFATLKGKPIYLGDATEEDYKNSELYTINEDKKGRRNKKEAIKQYNVKMYNKLKNE
ncbi:MAG: sel1 repeat family protein [Prevotellaceae bacterium]|jgi:TPR repeat protein|nr:sel1 repeat family protein [Prevotellaceae bacterium]